MPPRSGVSKHFTNRATFGEVKMNGAYHLAFFEPLTCKFVTISLCTVSRACFYFHVFLLVLCFVSLYCLQLGRHCKLLLFLLLFLLLLQRLFYASIYRLQQLNTITMHNTLERMELITIPRLTSWLASVPFGRNFPACRLYFFDFVMDFSKIWAMCQWKHEYGPEFALWMNYDHVSPKQYNFSTCYMHSFFTRTPNLLPSLNIPKFSNFEPRII